MKNFDTSVEQIYAIWIEEMQKAQGNPSLQLNEKYLNKFKLEALEIGLTKFPIWALKNSASKSLKIVNTLMQPRLKLSIWKKNALELVLKDDRSDIETFSDGTMRVIPETPTDIGRKRIGPIQNYEQDT